MNTDKETLRFFTNYLRRPSVFICVYRWLSVIPLPTRRLADQAMEELLHLL
jgi:hypothetical protein